MKTLKEKLSLNSIKEKLSLHSIKEKLSLHSILEFLINDNKVKQEPITEFLVNKPITNNANTDKNTDKNLNEFCKYCKDKDIKLSPKTFFFNGKEVKLDELNHKDVTFVIYDINTLNTFKRFKPTKRKRNQFVYCSIYRCRAGESTPSYDRDHDKYPDNVYYMDATKVVTKWDKDSNGFTLNYKDDLYNKYKLTDKDLEKEYSNKNFKYIICEHTSILSK